MNENRQQENARRALDEMAANLDTGSLARLRRARSRAVEAHASARGRWRPARWLAPLATASLATLVLSVGVWLWSDTSTPQAFTAIDDVELLAAGDAPDFYQELEFYVWLASRTPAT